MLQPVIPSCDGVIDQERVNKFTSIELAVDIVFPGVLQITFANGGFGSPIEQAGTGFTVTVPLAASAAQPLAPVTVTV